MDTELIKKFMDSFHLAKKIPGMMPKLPDGLTPRHIHIMECICRSGEKGIRISGIASELGSTMPSITKLVNQLVSMGFAVKEQDDSDKRAFSIKATSSGMDLYYIYVEEYYKVLADLFSEIPEEQLRTTMDVIKRTYSLLKENPVSVTDLTG